ncbi:MAG: hypothetical protein ACU833_01235 [Gammaproteobacteria bacterium]
MSSTRRDERPTLNSFRITGGDEKEIAGQTLYKAEFIAEITIFLDSCQKPDRICGAADLWNKTVAGDAFFNWTGHGWEKAGVVLHN